MSIKVIHQGQRVATFLPCIEGQLLAVREARQISLRNPDTAVYLVEGNSRQIFRNGRVIF